jgi:transcriptional regulator with XRE-family HTH domain
MSQVTLAQRSGLSLPSIQNIETGKSNPALETIEQVLSAVGYRWRPTIKSADWDLLAACGAPLTSHASGKPTHVSRDILLRTLPRACLELAQSEKVSDRERKREALQALILALQTHFPSVYSKIENAPVVRQMTRVPITGRIIKLRRQAISRLAEYL